jgi:hypothetical protein
MRRGTAKVATVVAIAIAWAFSAVAYERPAFDVERREGDFEIRRYPALVVAETVVEGSFSGSGDEAFRRLAAYIGGNNRSTESIAMTAPVAQDRPERLAMTAPVTQTSLETSHRFAFFMPAGYELASLPAPLDPRIALRVLAPRRVAVVRYRGGWSESRYSRELDRLRHWIAAGELPDQGGPAVWARYDPPFLPWFLRRNEIWIELASGDHGTPQATRSAKGTDP